ncbi:YtxH domain-containing protein [candidate division WWE3 bacterium]|uniref:YtxH domain-containing protein n=1 Tax=candidate division WWE3 bacterium TaxID=2053526 RepID=A0A955LVX4_UNCKA|nr:YtxH domain-containing protein [candidate division WWE3 bacterium]
MTEYKRTDNPIDKSFLMGALVGAAAGVVATLFLAPESGEKTRKTLKKKVQKLGKEVNKIQEKVAKEGIDIKKGVHQAATKFADNVENEAKRNINQAATKVSETSQQVIEATKPTKSVSKQSTTTVRKSRRPKFFQGV